MQSDFFKSWQKKAALGKVGKKRPEHSILMSKYAKEGRLKTLIEMTDERREFLSKRAIDWHKTHEHPMGFKGKKHNEESKIKISMASKKAWADPNSKVNSESNRQKRSDNAMKNTKLLHGDNMYSRAKKGKAEIGGKTYFYRSSWEVNIAAYFELLKSKGEIKDWEYEVDTYWFLKIMRGVRSYKPDFKIFRNDGTFYYEEVKGWLDNKSKTKLNRMRIYYPKIEVRLLGKDRYNAILKMKSMIPNWGLFDNI